MAPNISNSPVNHPETPQLLLFAKFPSPGSCKTRLIPRLGALGASDFALAALIDTLHLFADLRRVVKRTLFYAPVSSRPLVISLLSSQNLTTKWSIQPQSESSTTGKDDLGYRLSSALSQTYSREGISPGCVTFIGMDCFTLLPMHVEKAIKAATETEKAYMIPAKDGGYVLLCLPTLCPETVFQRIPWSCERTGRVQRDRLDEAGVGCLMGEEMPDIDEVEDLDQLWDELRGNGMTGLMRTHPRTAAFLEAHMTQNSVSDLVHQP
jgi:glycosyltransferase A (GT-A) superfamily protein (DUF2064 family)